VYFDNFNCLGVTHECDRQTDGQTDILAHGIMLRFTVLHGPKTVLLVNQSNTSSVIFYYL